METLRYIFQFDAASPLLFTQFYFWVFLAIVYTVFAAIVEWGKGPKDSHTRLHLRNIFLMAVSWFFYYKTSGIFLFILATLTFCNWAIALWMHDAQGKNNLGLTKMWLILSILLDLGFLFYYKYAYFGVDIFNSLTGSHFSIVDKIILPVGISFYTFQVISYVVDVYRRQVQPVSNVLDFGFYVSFFPQLVAGPIVRASEFVPQLYKPFHLSRRQMGIALFWILNGLAKKIILSDYLAVNLIDRVFENPMLFSGFENLFALFAYSMQVYADFSGYTDIAIGVALLMGFYLPQNFDSPYKSRNPQEFWRRWHQSLSRWLKSYVYIPLGGNKTLFGHKAPKLLASNVNSFATMLIGGLWHGASWNFIIWGGLNGIGMIIAKCWHSLKETVTGGMQAKMQANSPRLYKWICNADNVVCILLTFTFITFTRLFFRSSSNLDPATANEVAWETARNMIGQITGAWNSSVIIPFVCEYWKVVVLFFMGMIIHWLPANFKRRYRIWFAQMPLWLMAISIIVVVAIVYQFISADMQPFIYFQF
ncbi:MAG: MBOAT family protein [Paludibacteraceae bacterium]|nr:MBOAT family protein [Paludibacteraceae bacterium]